MARISKQSKQRPYTINRGAVAIQKKPEAYVISAHPLGYAIASKAKKKAVGNFQEELKRAKRQVKEYRQGSPLAIYKNAPVTFAQKLGLEIVTDDQRKILLSVRDKKVTNVQASHGVGKCVAPDDLLLLANGLEVPASSLVGQEFKLLTYVGGEILPVNAKAVWNLVEDVYEITTESGRKIVRSANHPLFAAIKWSRNGAKPLIDVKEWQAIATLQEWLEQPPEYPKSKFTSDDWDTSKFKHNVVCAVPHTVDVFGDRPMPEHEIKIIAYLIGDGSLTNGTPSFAQEDNRQLKEVAECASKMGCVVKPIKGDDYSYRIAVNNSDSFSGDRKALPGLKEKRDFSLYAHHVSIRKIREETGHKVTKTYNRLKALNVKPLQFYGCSYITYSQYLLYKAFDQCVEESARSRNDNGSYSEALRILQKQMHGFSNIQDTAEKIPDLELLEQQLKDAVYKQKILHGVQPGTRRGGSKPNPVTNLLKKHDLMGKNSHEKLIPSVIFQLPKHQLVLFLNRLFSTDGWACVSKPPSGRSHGTPEIGFCSVSRNLVEQVQRLLLRFGIVANVIPKPNVNAWVLYIHASDMLYTFCQEIGIYGKEDAIAKVLERLKTIDNNRTHKWRYKKAPNGTIWERVISIRKLEKQQMTVAIEVPQYNTYITNFWEHNTLISAIAGLWWVFCCDGLVISTAPTGRQVKELLWREIRKLYDRNKRLLGGYRNVLSIHRSSDAYGFGFSAQDKNQHSFQGIHHERLLIIEDEACGISQEIDDGAVSCATGSDNRILRIGNPTEPGTPFEKHCKKNNIRIPVWFHPNVSWAYEMHPCGFHRLKPAIATQICQDDPDQPVKPQEEWNKELPRDVIPGAVSIGWIEEQRVKKLEGSAFWMGKVEGIFPIDNAASVIPTSLFLACRARYDEDPEWWENHARLSRTRYGLDVADGGDDNALSKWRGSLLYKVKVQPTLGDNLDTDRAAGLATGEASQDPGVISVDNVGVGAGTLAIILKNRYKAVGIRWGESAKDKEAFANLKAEDYWLLREAMRVGDVAIAPLGHIEDRVMEDLASVHYEELGESKIKIERKKDTIERLGRSPDAGDAVVLGYRVRNVISGTIT